jgi:hypothetical protein
MHNLGIILNRMMVQMSVMILGFLSGPLKRRINPDTKNHRKDTSTQEKNRKRYMNIENSNSSTLQKQLPDSADFRIGFLISILLTASMVLPISVFAISNPAGVVMEAISKIQSKGDASPYVEYLDWDHMYTNLTPEKKEFLEVSSQSELKESYRRILKYPSKHVLKILKNNINSKNIAHSDDKKAEMKNTPYEKFYEGAIEKEKEMKKMIRESIYSVKHTEIDGNHAVVTLEQLYQGRTRTDKVKMHLKDGSWYFTGFVGSLTSMYTPRDLIFHKGN